jgi:hypothetical protein
MRTGKPKPRKRSKIKRTDPKQSARFIAAAQELGLEGTGDAFERAMNTLAPKKPKRRSS